MWTPVGGKLPRRPVGSPADKGKESCGSVDLRRLLMFYVSRSIPAKEWLRSKSPTGNQDDQFVIDGLEYIKR
jgi:hypothetical protein